MSSMGMMMVDLNIHTREQKSTKLGDFVPSIIGKVCLSRPHAYIVVILAQLLDNLGLWEIVLAWCLPRVSTVAEHADMYNDVNLQTPVVVRSDEVVKVHRCVCRDVGVVHLQSTQDAVRERAVAMRSWRQGSFSL